MTEPVTRCDLCKQPLAHDETIELWRWVLHPDCRIKASRRLMRFLAWLVGDEFEADCEAAPYQASEVLE